MLIGIAGTRGSIAAPSGTFFWGGGISTAKYGGNTTCIYFKDQHGMEGVFDLGTGGRGLGRHLAEKGGFNGTGRNLNVFISHTHWDHVQGIPFFIPVYIPGNNIKIFGERKSRINPSGASIRDQLDTVLKENSGVDGSQSNDPSFESCLIHGPCTPPDSEIRNVVADQQKQRNFPVGIEYLSGVTSYLDFDAGDIVYRSQFLRSLVIIDTLRVNHPGGCISYRVTEVKPNGSKKVFVFSTDFEPGEKGLDDKVMEFWQGSDLVIADGQYEPKGSAFLENKFETGYGHSDYVTDLTWATRAGVKKLVITHHEPKVGDDYHDGLELRAKAAARVIADDLGKNPIEVELAKEGTVYEL